MSSLLFGFFDLRYVLIVLLPSMVVSGVATWLVRIRFGKYSKIPSSRGYTGEMAAQRLLDFAEVKDVQVVRVDGVLTNHFNPTTKKLALSSAVFDSTSIAAIGIATHEAGHAIQPAKAYYPPKWRSILVPVASIVSKCGVFGIMIGAALAASGVVFGTSVFIVAAASFLIFVLFHLMTLPVEFGAGRHAENLVIEAGIVGEKEREGIDKMLTAAAMSQLATFAGVLPDDIEAAQWPESIAK